MTEQHTKQTGDKVEDVVEEMLDDENPATDEDETVDDEERPIDRTGESAVEADDHYTS